MEVRVSTNPIIEFAACILLSILTFSLTIWLDAGLARELISMPVLLFLPGFSLVSLYFPLRDPDVEQISFSDVLESRRLPTASERIILAFFISLALTSVTHFYITTYEIGETGDMPTIISIFYLFIGSLSYLRSLRYEQDQLFSYRIFFKTPSLESLDGYKSLQIFVIFVVLILSLPILISINPDQDEGFSQIYLLNSGGEANEYVSEVQVGEPFSVILGISNNEGHEQEYSLQIERNYFGQNSPFSDSPISSNIDSTDSLSLQNNELYQSEYPIAFQEQGLWKVQFDLYLATPETEQEPTVSVYLWVLSS